MKTLTAVMIALAIGSTAYAVEPVNGSGQGMGQPSVEEITLAFGDTVAGENAPGECKAVCMLPMVDGEVDLPWVD